MPIVALKQAKFIYQIQIVPSSYDLDFINKEIVFLCFWLPSVYNLQAFIVVNITLEVYGPLQVT
jgi:hypothetical protein